VDTTAAAAEGARRKVKRAAGLLKDATRDLAALTEGQQALGVLRVHDMNTVNDARDLISLGVARHGAVDVIVIARPNGRVHIPPTAATAAKEKHA